MRTITLLSALLAVPALLSTAGLAESVPLGISTPAHAQDAGEGEAEAEDEEGPEDGYIYDLDKLGVKVALLPKEEWKHDHWSGWDLKAAHEKDAVEAIVWTTDFQMDIEEADLEAWGEVYINKAGERQVTEAQVAESSVQPDVHGGNAGMFKVTGKSKDGDDVVMYGAAIPVEGFVMHVATLSLAAKAGKAEEYRGLIVENLDIQAKPADLGWGAEMTVPEALAAKLDPYWRPALKRERDAQNRVVKSVGQSLRGCWAAIHPQPPNKADLFLACQDKNHTWTVVNERTFADQEAELRDAWLGDADPGSQYKAQDRLGFMWDTQIGKRQIHLLALPIEGGMLKATAIANGGDPAKVASTATATIDAASFAPPADPPFDEYFRYLVRYEPMSPLIIGPAVAAVIILLLIFVVIIIGLRRQAAQARAEMESI